MRSHLLEGVVRHRRVRPFVYALEHRRLLRRPRPRRARRGAAAGSGRSAGTAGTCCRSATTTTWTRRRTTCGRGCATTCEAKASDPEGWQVTLVTNLRVVGYVFNPASFYLCRDRSGDLRVGHRRGPQHPRRAPPLQPPRRGGRAGLRRLDGQGVLRLALHRDGRRATRSGSATRPARLRITINEDPGDGLLLHTSLDLRPPPADRPDGRCACSSAIRS